MNDFKMDQRKILWIISRCLQWKNKPPKLKRSICKRSKFTVLCKTYISLTIFSLFCTFGQMKSSWFSDPVNVSASAPGDFQLNVTWDRPRELHSFINFTENTTTVSTWDAVKVKLNTCFYLFIYNYLWPYPQNIDNSVNYFVSRKYEWPSVTLEENFFFHRFLLHSWR